MKNIWASANLTTNIKIKIFNSTIKPVPVYRAETWRTMTAIMKKIQTFICLRRILRIRWPETINNTELWKWTKQEPTEDKILKNAGDGLDTHPPKANDLYCTLSPDLEPLGDDRDLGQRRQLERLAQDWYARRALVGGLCSSRGKGNSGDNDGAMHFNCSQRIGGHERM